MVGANLDSFNPYQPPETPPAELPPLPTGDRAIREQFIHLEANLMSVGVLLLWGGMLVASISGVAVFLYLAAGWNEGTTILLTIGFVLAIGQAIAGIGVRNLNSEARGAAIVFCMLWTLFIPLGTLLGVACLWYLLQPSAVRIFSREYRDLMARTPGVVATTTVSSAAIFIFMISAMAALVALAVFV